MQFLMLGHFGRSSFALKTMTFGRYISGTSPLHRLDPRTKILCSLVLATLIFTCDSPVFLGGFVLVLFFAPALIGLPLSVTSSLQRSLLPLLTLVFVLNAVVTPGDPLQVFSYPVGFISVEGFTRGGLLALRLNTITFLFAWLSICTSPSELSDSLNVLLKPLRRLGVPTQDLTLALTVALRFVPIVFTEAERIHHAQVSRGAQISGVHRLTRFIPVLMPLFVAAFTRAEKLTQTLESRGYRHRAARSMYHTLAFKTGDWFAFIGIACFATLLFVTL